MTRILLPSVDCLPQIGGISLMAHHLANALTHRGADVHVLAPKGACIPAGFEADYSLIEDTSARPRDRQGRVWREGGEESRVRALLRGLVRKLDVDRVLLLHPFYYGPPSMGLTRRDGPVPVSMYFHGFELRSQLTLDMRQKSARQRLRGEWPTLRDLTLASARQADEILTNSRYTARLVGQIGVKSPVFVTGCGLSEQDYREGLRRAPSFDPIVKRRFRETLGLPTDRPVIGAVGRLVASKNIPLILQALKQAPDIHAVIVGDGPDKGALHALAEDLDVSSQVSWRENISEADKWDLLASLDAFCLVSKKAAHGRVEGFGIVLLEAAAAGTPVIATPSGGMVDVVAHEHTGLCVGVGDAAGLVSAWRRLVGDGDLAARLVRAARRQIEARYNWPAIATTLLRRWAIAASKADVA